MLAHSVANDLEVLNLSLRALVVAADTSREIAPRSMETVHAAFAVSYRRSVVAAALLVIACTAIDLIRNGAADRLIATRALLRRQVFRNQNHQGEAAKVFLKQLDRQRVTTATISKKRTTPGNNGRHRCFLVNLGLAQ